LIEEDGSINTQSCITPDQGNSSEAVNEDVEAIKETVTNGLPRYVISGADLMSRQVDEMPTLLKPFLQKVGIAVMVGSSDTGKSSFLRQLATAVALDEKEFLGYKLNLTHHSAIYVSTEDDEDSMCNLMQKQNKGKDRSQFNNDLRYIFQNRNVRTMIADELTRAPADLVVIDTFSDVLATTDVNNAIVVRKFFKPYQRLANKHKCLFIFNHHTKKSQDNGLPSKHAVLGSMGIESRARVLLELRKDRFDIGLRHLLILKGNYLPGELKLRSLVLKFDDDMVFTNTGRERNIEELAGESSHNQHDELMERATELKREGHSLSNSIVMWTDGQS
jgi:archaellum biogenesis ATPase FlaH